MRPCKRAAHGTALFYVLSVLALGAFPAVACPTAADLDSAGVRFANDEGESVLHRRLDPLRIVADWSVAGDDYISRSVLIRGVYVESVVDVTRGVVDQASGGTFARPEAPEALPGPQPGMTWTGGHVYTDARGSLTEDLTITVGDQRKVLFGACSYDIYPVLMTYDGPGDSYTEEVHYFPTLGTGILVGGQDSTGPYTYSYNRIVAEGAQ